MPSFGRVSDFFDLTKGEIPLVRDHAKQTGVALEKAYQFTLWLIPTVEKFPRAQKFLLRDRIKTAALDVVKGLDVGEGHCSPVLFPSLLIDPDWLM